MGFGILLFGYFAATVLGLKISIFKLVGFSVAAFGIKKLSQYNRCFTVLLYSCFALIAASACCSLCDVSDFLYTYMLTAQRLIPLSLVTVFNYVRIGVECVFTLIMCFSVWSIAKETGATKIAYISMRNLILFSIYVLAYVADEILLFVSTDAITAFLQSTAMPALVFLFGFIMYVLNCLMIFSCYTKICDENDVDMAQKPSRFEFVNRMRAESEERAKERRKKFDGNTKSGSLDKKLYSDEQQRRSEVAAKKKKKSKGK
jgi:hypothetical protein